MLKTDADAFRKLLSGTMELYNRMVSDDAARLWWASLAKYEFQEIRRAFSEYVTGPDGRFPPVPATIIERLGTGLPKFPEPNEAWAIGLKSTDEALTVCWTDEIAQAMGSAQPILQRGDEVGGRMAFIETYKRLVGEAKAAGRAPRWSMSYGDDPHMRIEAERQAQKAGLLPAPKPAAERLEGPKLTPEQIQANKDRLAGMMRELADSLRTNADAQAAAEAEAREQERQEFEARKQRAIEELIHAESPAAGPAAE